MVRKNASAVSAGREESGFPTRLPLSRHPPRHIVPTKLSRTFRVWDKLQKIARKKLTRGSKMGETRRRSRRESGREEVPGQGRERVTGNGNDMQEEKRLRDSLGYRKDARVKRACILLVPTCLGAPWFSVVMAVYSELGLRASPFSEGLRRCRGCAILSPTFFCQKGVRRDGIYLRGRARRFLCSAVRTYACTHTCARHNGDSTSSHGLLNKPRKSRDVSPARHDNAPPS